MDKKRQKQSQLVMTKMIETHTAMEKQSQLLTKDGKLIEVGKTYFIRFGDYDFHTINFRKITKLKDNKKSLFTTNYKVTYFNYSDPSAKGKKVTEVWWPGLSQDMVYASLRSMAEDFYRRLNWAVDETKKLTSVLRSINSMMLIEGKI